MPSFPPLFPPVRYATINYHIRDTNNAAGASLTTDAASWDTIATGALTRPADAGFDIASRRFRPLGWFRVTAGTGYYRWRGETTTPGSFVSPDPLLEYSTTSTTWVAGVDAVTGFTYLPDGAYQFWLQAYNSPGGAGYETLIETPTFMEEILLG